MDPRYENVKAYDACTYWIVREHPARPTSMQDVNIYSNHAMCFTKEHGHALQHQPGYIV